MDEASLIQKVMSWIQAHQSSAPWLMFLLAFGESAPLVSFVLPFWGILIAVGVWLGTMGGFENPLFWYSLAGAAIGAALGDWVAYWLGRRYRDTIWSWPVLRDHASLRDTGLAFFDRWGGWAIVFGRFSGPLRASIPIVAGAVNMHRGTFQFANWTSAFIWAGVLLVFGDAVGRVWNVVGPHIVPYTREILVSAAVVTVLAFVLYLLRRLRTQ